MSLLRDIVVFLCGFLMMNGASAQVVASGSCPNVTVVQNFQADQYLGKWYEYEKYFAIFELGGKCVTAEYSDDGNGVVGVTNRMINTLKGNQPTSIKGTARLTSSTEGKLEVKFPSAPFPAPYWILDTDYTSYAVIWSCTDFKLLNLNFSWVLTRERNPSDEVLQKAYAAIDKNGINKKLYMKTDQSGCDN